MGFPREAAESGKEGAQDVTKGNNRQQDKQPRERTQEKGGKGKTFTIGLAPSVAYLEIQLPFQEEQKDGV